MVSAVDELLQASVTETVIFLSHTYADGLVIVRHSPLAILSMGVAGMHSFLGRTPGALRICVYVCVHVYIYICVCVCVC